MNDKELFKDNIRETHWLGEVVVNEEAASNCGIPLLIYAKKINEESASA